MALGTAASFVGTYTRREHPVKCWKAWSAFSSTVPAWWGRTQPMVPADLSVSKQRSERRISVRLPLNVRGRDGRVVHVADSQQPGDCLIGEQFTGPRFQRVFRSESAA